MELKQEDARADLGGSSTWPHPPPPEHHAHQTEEMRVEQQRVDNCRLQDSLNAVTRQLQALDTIMGRSELAQDPTTYLHRHRKSILKVANFQYPETRTVGLIGNTGVGKSTVINSTLGGNSLARTSDDVNACTCVIVEYRALDEEHTKPYTVEVEYMDLQEMRDFLGHHLQSYRHCYFELERPKMMHATDEDWIPADDAEDPYGAEDGDDVKLAETETVKLQKAKQSAQDTFKTLFKGPDEPTLEDLTRDDSPNAEDEILDTLLEKAKMGLTHRPGGAEATLYAKAPEDLGKDDLEKDDLKKDDLEENDLHTDNLETDDIQKCRDLLDLLTTDRQGDEPTIWPFIKLIRVYLDAPILKTGLVLADMPGLRDLNYARQEATERYIKKQCHVLGFVTRISRCLTDETIEEIKWKIWTTTPAIVIATRADEVGGTGSDRGDPSHDIVLRDLNARIKQAKQEAARVRSAMKKACDSEKGDLTEKWQELLDEEQDLEFQKKRVQVEYRNRKTIAGMAAMPSRKDMKVFCVGNNDYLTNCDGDSERSKAYVELSGIPQLRLYCRSITAEAQMQHVANFCRFIVPSSVASVLLWANGAFDDERKAQATGISEMLQKLENDLALTFKSNHHGMLKGIRDELERLFQRRVGGAIDGFRSEWKEQCKELCKGWVQWPCASFAAACRKHGVHTTRANGNCNWNAELIEPIYEKMAVPWDEFMDCLNQQKDGIADQITKKITQICAPLQDDNELTSISRNGLLAGMQLRQTAIIEAFQQAFQEVFQQAKIVKDNMINVKDSKTAIITKYMLSAYRYASLQSGKGSDWRRKTYMENHIDPDPERSTNGGGGIVGNYKSRSRDEWSHALKPLFKTLRKKVAEVIDHQILDIQTVAAEQGMLPEAVRDTTTAAEVLGQLKALDKVLADAQEVLREIQSNRT